MDNDESIKLAPLKKTSLPGHFPEQGFSSKMPYPAVSSRNRNEEVPTSTTTTSYGHDVNRIASMHRPLKSHYHENTYVDAIEEHAQRIVDKLEQDDDLMEDTPISELLRQETLRELPQCLTIKRCVKAKLSKSINLKSKHKQMTFEQQLTFKWNKFKVKLLNNLTSLELWYGSLKRIEGNFGSSYASFFKFLRYLFILNSILTMPLIVFLIAPQIIFDSNGNNTIGFKFQDIFTGNGFFYDTILYYGHYTDQNVHFYSMPIAYFSVMLIIYLISFIVLSISVATSYRRNFIETEGGLKNIFANKVFCSWDYGIATKRAAKLKSDTIYNEIKELINESLQDDEDRSCIYKFWTITIQIIVNIIIIILIISIGYGLWLLLDNYGFNTDDLKVLPAIIVNLILMILPVIFSAITKYEDYKNPRIALYITLTRTYLLGIVVTGVTVLFWLCKALPCWETLLGQELYRLIVFDFIFSVIIKSSFDLFRFLIMRTRGYKTPTSEFDIATNTLQIIYNQSLFLIGLIYSPVLSIIIILKLFIIWYVRDLSVRRLCRPLQRSWRAAQTTTYFLMITFITNVLVLGLHGYTITSVKTSKSCGPFRNYNYIYEIITNGDDIEKQIIFYITKPWIVTLFIIGLSIGVYYLKEKAQAQRDKVKLLRELLIWSAKDKKFLLEYIHSTTGRLDFISHGSRSFDNTDFDFYDE